MAAETEDAPLNNQLCWWGSLDGFAEIVWPACQRAVELAPDAEKPIYQDTRGLARALRGDLQGAAEDFEVFVGWAKEAGIADTMIDTRERWITKLQAGRNPFDAATLEALRSEVTEYAEVVDEPVMDGPATPVGEPLGSMLASPAPTFLPASTPPGTSTPAGSQPSS